MEKVRKDGSPVTPAWVGAFSHGVIGSAAGMGAGGLAYLLGKHYVKNRLGPSFVPAFERKYVNGFLPVGDGAAAGAALGLGYWGGKKLYNKWKNRNKTTESAFASASLREVLDRSDKPRDLSNPYDRAQLGLDIARTFGADKVISDRLQKPEHRANAWRGALKGAAIGLGGLGAVAVGGVLGERLLHGARAFRYSRGLGKTLSKAWKFAKDEVRSRFHPLLPSLGEELIAASKYAPKVAAAGGGIGGLYGLMKNSKTTKKGVSKTTESAFTEAFLRESDQEEQEFKAARRKNTIRGALAGGAAGMALAGTSRPAIYAGMSALGAGIGAASSHLARRRNPDYNKSPQTFGQRVKRYGGLGAATGAAGISARMAQYALRGGKVGLVEPVLGAGLGAAVGGIAGAGVGAASHLYRKIRPNTTESARSSRGNLLEISPELAGRAYGKRFDTNALTNKRLNTYAAYLGRSSRDGVGRFFGASIGDVATSAPSAPRFGGGKKLAIGAGAAALGYGAYRAYKRLKNASAQPNNTTESAFVEAFGDDFWAQRAKKLADIKKKWEARRSLSTALPGAGTQSAARTVGSAGSIFGTLSKDDYRIARLKHRIARLKLSSTSNSFSNIREAYNPATGNVVGALGRKVKELAVAGERIRPQRKILMIGGVPHHFLNGKLVQRGARMLQATDRAFTNLFEAKEKEDKHWWLQAL